MGRAPLSMCDLYLTAARQGGMAAPSYANGPSVDRRTAILTVIVGLDPATRSVPLKRGLPGQAR